jgi:hypothetical protein
MNLFNDVKPGSKAWDLRVDWCQYMDDCPAAKSKAAAREYMRACVAAFDRGEEIDGPTLLEAVRVFLGTKGRKAVKA